MHLCDLKGQIRLKEGLRAMDEGFGSIVALEGARGTIYLARRGMGLDSRPLKWFYSQGVRDRPTYRATNAHLNTLFSIPILLGEKNLLN